jgi:hypothetical protein
MVFNPWAESLALVFDAEHRELNYFICVPRSVSKGGLKITLSSDNHHFHFCKSGILPIFIGE